MAAADHCSFIDSIYTGERQVSGSAGRLSLPEPGKIVDVSPAFTPCLM
ncbi:MAG: hypothetical protein HQL18_00630 [Candidatus Omnitrophica bacterium]|nr:hypothetical protein [Candidatus Omnitrophota bacterium]